MVQARSEGQPALERGDTELRSLAQLKMLHTLAAPPAEGAAGNNEAAGGL